MRRPGRMITLPSISSRRIRLGEPTSSAPSGVIVAALIDKPHSRIAAAASVTTAFSVLRRLSSDRSKWSSWACTSVTLGSRTRSACSSSSWPVSSPSSTTIRRSATYGDSSERPLQLVRGRDGARGRLASGRARRRAGRDVLPAGARGAVGDAGRALERGVAEGAGRPRRLAYRMRPLRRSAARSLRADRAPPRGAPDPGRVLLGRPHGRVGKARRALAKGRSAAYLGRMTWRILGPLAGAVAIVGVVVALLAPSNGTVIDPVASAADTTAAAGTAEFG